MNDFNFDGKIAVSDSTLADALDCSRTSVWRRVKDGTLPPPVRIGGASRFLVADIRDALDALRTSPGGKTGEAA
jgi:predicted DNA-binding transcriptional regulator AlpA